MSEKEREILQKLSEIVPKLPDTKKERLLGVAEGMSIVRENEREKEDKSAFQEEMRGKGT